MYRKKTKLKLPSFLNFFQVVSMLQITHYLPKTTVLKPVNKFSLLSPLISDKSFS